MALTLAYGVKCTISAIAGAVTPRDNCSSVMACNMTQHLFGATANLFVIILQR